MKKAKASKAEKLLKNEDKKRLKKEKKEKKEKKKKEKKEKKKKKHERMQSYQEYDIEDHIQPIGFQPEFRYSNSQKQKHLQFGGSFKNVLVSKPQNGTTGGGLPTMTLPMPPKRKRKHIQSRSTPSLPTKQAIFEGIEDEYTYGDSVHLTPKRIVKPRYDEKPSRSDIQTNSSPYTESRDSINMMGDDMDDMVPPKRKTNESHISNRTNTMISHDDSDTMISRSSRSCTTSRSTISRSSLSNSSDLNLIDTINHVSSHQSVEHQFNAHSNNSSMVLDLGKKGRRLTLEEKVSANKANRVSKKNIDRGESEIIVGRNVRKLHDRRTSAILVNSLPLNQIITGQNGYKNKNKNTNKNKKKKREFRYKQRKDSASVTSQSGSYLLKSLSARVSDKEKSDKYGEIPVNITIGNKTKTKRYNTKQIDQYGHRLIPKITSLSNKKTDKKSKAAVAIGGGYGYDPNDGQSNVPTHLRAYYAIQKDLISLKNSTKKKQNKTQLDAINSKLHTLFFANERTNIANLAAFQKFFIDRMSVKSVHKDLDWHICLLRPKIHSRTQDAQIDEIISAVADLLRKCVKKFNNKRGHLTSASNTSRIGVGTYGGGKDKTLIQSAFILSKKPSSSVPPEFYQQTRNTSYSVPAQHYGMNRAHTPSGQSATSGSLVSLHINNDLLGINMDLNTDHYMSSPSPYGSDSEYGLNMYDVMSPPASVQMKQDLKKNKKEKQKEKHRRLLSFSSRKRKQKKREKEREVSRSRPMMSMQEVVALTGLPGTKKAKGSDHHNVDEPYPMELFHISDMDFVLVYYVKFLTKFEKLMCEFLSLYQQYCRLSDDIASDIAVSLSLVASNPRETYMESMLKAHNTLTWGRQSREHPWIKVQTDKRKSQKFGQDLIYMVKYMKSNDIDALHELMKQAPDLNTKDRESGKTVLQIALDKSCKQPSFAFVARYLALKQLLFQQKLQDESIIMQALQTANPMVAEILLHLDPDLNIVTSLDTGRRSALDLALNANYRNLARYMIKLNVPEWHTQLLIRRWSSACEMGDVVKLRSVLQRGFNIDYFPNNTQQTALIICTKRGYKECVEFLLKKGCNVNATDLKQKTALHFAAINLNGELFRLLMESKANWSLRDLEDKTPIKYVMENIGFIARKKPESPRKESILNTLPSAQQSPQSGRFRSGSGSNVDLMNNVFFNINPQTLGNKAKSKDDDMYNDKRNRFWRPSGFDGAIELNANDDDDDDWDEFGYLVEVQRDDDDDEEEEDEEVEVLEDDGRIVYKDVDVQQVVKIVDIASQADIPLDSRLLLLAVQRDWPHVILVLCHQRNNVSINVDIAGKDGITPVMLAAREGKKACLSALLQSAKPDLDLVDTAERTAIMHAAYRGEAECVERLHKAGAQLDVETVDGTTLLMAACYGGLDGFAKYLIEQRADVTAVNENGFSALLFAASEGYQDTVTLLLTNSASINVVSRAGLTPLMAGCSGGLHELVLYVLARINRSDMDETDENGWTALMHAVASGSEKCAAILLKAGASVVNVGDDGYSLLSIAIMGNLAWMVRHILDVIRKQMNTKNRKQIYNMFNVREHGNGFTAIHEAAGIGADKCLALLAEYNDKYFDTKMILFDQTDLNGRSPLMIAALNGHNKCVNLIINHESLDININKVDNEGNSVLMYAMESDHMQILKILLNRYKDKINSATLQRAKDAAIQRSKHQMLQLLNECPIHTQYHAHAHGGDDDDYDHYD